MRTNLPCVVSRRSLLSGSSQTQTCDVSKGCDAIGPQFLGKQGGGDATSYRFGAKGNHSPFVFFGGAPWMPWRRSTCQKEMNHELLVLLTLPHRDTMAPLCLFFSPSTQTMARIWEGAQPSLCFFLIPTASFAYFAILSCNTMTPQLKPHSRTAQRQQDHENKQ
ncbi:hypothetical protein BC940DRAFT_309879 [Gongronella butleri]|nr:hypothetical protein BC940DRAFT_309879 [Gongronella butleri]